VEVIDDHALVVLRADIDFTHDDRGRMVQTNEPYPEARTPAPRLLLAQSSHGYVARIRANVPEDQAARLTSIVESLPITEALDSPIAGIDRLREELTRESPIAAEGGGPAYRFPAPIPSRKPVVRLANDNRELVRETYPWLFDELPHWWPCFAVVADGSAVAVCFSARRGGTAAEAGVETLSAFRGHGYATAVTSAWAQSIQQAGLIPIYSTGWANLASQGVARRLGLRIFGSDVTWW
jgi:hypothetical protein